MEQKYDTAAQKARKRRFPTKGLRKPVQQAFTAKGKVFYHDYYTTITIPEHVGTRSVLISMNDIMCPEVNFNSSFVVPGARFLERSVDEIGYDNLKSNPNKPISRATREYKFLFRSPDNEVTTSAKCGAEVDQSKVNEVWRKNDRLFHGTMQRLTRGCYGSGTYKIKPGPDPDFQYENSTLTLKGVDDGEIVTRHITHHQEKSNNCSVLGTVCKGTYFIPRNGAIEHYLRRCRSCTSDPSDTSNLYLPNQEFFYKVGFDPTGIHAVNLTSNVYANVPPAIAPYMKLIKPNLAPGSYLIGGAWHHGLGFRPCNLPSYVPSFPEVRDRTFSTMFTLIDDNNPTWELTAGSPHKNGHLTDLQDEMSGLWKELSKKDFSEIMRVISLTEAEKKEILEDPASPLRNDVVGGTFAHRPPEEWCHDNNGVFIPADVGLYKVGGKMSTTPTEYKRIIQMARGVTENRKIYDHHMVIASKIDVELVDTSVKGRYLINDNGVQVISVHDSAVAGSQPFLQDHYNLSEKGGQNLGVEWGIQKVYPKNEEDFGVPTMDIAPDTHEKLPRKAELYDAKFNYCASYTTKNIREVMHDLHQDKTSAKRDDMFQLKGHYVNAFTGAGKTQLSSKYDMNSSIKRYRDVNPDGSTKSEVIPIKKDHRFVVNHSIDRDRQEIEHTSEMDGTPYAPFAQRAKNYDMREKYMPCFRIFTRRANPKMHEEVEHQTNVDPNSDTINLEYGKNFSTNTTFSIRAGVGLNQAGRVADELDGCRLTEFCTLRNRGLAHNFVGTDFGVADDQQDALTAGGIDTVSFNGAIDGTRRKEIAGSVCPAMKYRVRVRYKVYWWNDEDQNAVTPYVATTKHNAQESDWTTSAMNSDILSSTKKGNASVYELEEDDVIMAESKSDNRRDEQKEDQDNPIINLQMKHQLHNLYKTLNILNTSNSNMYNFQFFKDLYDSDVFRNAMYTVLTLHPHGDFSSWYPYMEKLIELTQGLQSEWQQQYTNAQNQGFRDNVIDVFLRAVYNNIVNARTTR